MRVIAITRHPVKSLRGESLDEAELDALGLRGDRHFGIRDELTGKILTGRREPALLMASARLDSDGQLEIALPDGASGCRRGDADERGLVTLARSPCLARRRPDGCSR